MPTGDPVCPKCGSMMIHSGHVCLKDALPTVLTTMVNRFDEELYAKTEEEIRNTWYFTYDHSKSDAQNLYEFFDMLRLHQSQARRWEEKHYGSACVVERVRDKYLWPRILDFLTEQKRKP